MFLIQSLNDELDIKGVAGTVQLGAHGSKGHTDMANFFLLALIAGPDRAFIGSGIDVRKMHLNFVMAALILLF